MSLTSPRHRFLLLLKLVSFSVSVICFEMAPNPLLATLDHSTILECEVPDEAVCSWTRDEVSVLLDMDLFREQKRGGSRKGDKSN